jgi:hypothetical protein
MAQISVREFCGWDLLSHLPATACLVWSFLGLSEMVGFKELASAFFTKDLTICTFCNLNFSPRSLLNRMRTAKSLVASAKNWMTKAPPGARLVPGEVEMAPIRQVAPRVLTEFEKMEASQLAIEGQHAARRLRLARMAATEEIALGTRVWSRLGNVGTAILLGVAIEAAMNAWERSEYIE